MKVGFIGLGRMGRAMAANLLKAGYEVTVWNRTAEKAGQLVEKGARLAASPLETAGGEVVMTMFAEDQAVEAVVFGQGSFLNAPALHVSHSTISVALADQPTAEHGGRFVSAPVFGRPAAAEAGKLFVVAAGNDSALQFSSAIFAAVAQQAFWIGTHPPDANLIKLSGNFTIMAAVDAMAEAMTLVEKGSVTPSKLLEVLTGTLFGAPVYHSYGEILLEQRFRPAGFAAPLGLKDMGLADAAATARRVTMPLLGIVRDHLRAAIG